MCVGKEEQSLLKVALTSEAAAGLGGASGLFSQGQKFRARASRGCRDKEDRWEDTGS